MQTEEDSPMLGTYRVVKPAGDTPSGPRIWAIGGGKGGVGKSVLTTSLALAMADGGPRCAVADLDLGGANLHTLLGVSRPRHTLGDFLSGRVRDLSELMCPTTVPGLFLVSSARAPLEIANPKHAQKQKLLRHLRRLDVSHVFVDLGAGTSFNVLDPFVAADERVMVVTPEPTAVENTYHFLKAAFFRSLREVAQGAGRSVLEQVSAEARREGLSPREMIEVACRLDPEVGGMLRQRSRHFAPYLVVNQVDDAEHRRVGYEMVAAARRHLGARLHFVGALERDAAVPTAVRRQQPVLQLFPGCAFSTSLREMVERIRAGEALDARHAPPRWRVLDEGPPVATHGVAAMEIAPPRLPRRKSAPAAPKLPALDLEHPGRSLRRCREHLRLSLREMEERTRIRHLDAIECERHLELPPDPYLEAQVRSYAEALGSPEADVLARQFVAAFRQERTARSRGLLERLWRSPRIAVLPRRAES